eukprot:1048740-Prorocentrum_minimum.AAC.1
MRVLVPGTPPDPPSPPGSPPPLSSDCTALGQRSAKWRFHARTPSKFANLSSVARAYPANLRAYGDRGALSPPG